MHSASRLVAFRSLDQLPEQEPLCATSTDGLEANSTCPTEKDPGRTGTELEANPFIPVEAPGVTGLIELILKDPVRLNRLIRDPELAVNLLSRFLVIALVGFTLFGVAASLVIASFHVWPSLTAVSRILRDGRPLIDFIPIPISGAALFLPWLDGSAYQLIAAYDLGLIAAAGICLPSLYFYGLLSGVRMSMLDVTIHTVKGMATTAIALVGVLPIYVALSMAVAILTPTAVLVYATLWLAMALPFVAGLWGVRSLYYGFVGLADTMPIDRRPHRTLFLSRLIVSWAACYTAVTPVMIYTLWEYLARS